MVTTYPTFQLDALDLLRVNEAKAWGTSINNYVEAREEDGKLDITVCCKQMHTDRCLHVRSHHPTHVKRDMVRCLHNHARYIVQQGQNAKEENHLMKAFTGNGYPRSSSVLPLQSSL